MNDWIQNECLNDSVTEWKNDWLNEEMYGLIDFWMDKKQDSY